jgi:proline iminopeptidase
MRLYLATFAMAVLIAAASISIADPTPEPSDRTLNQATTSDGVKIAWWKAGRGPAILVIHGGPGQGTRSFRDMGGDALERFATVIYYDQRGSGLSGEAKDYSLPRMVEDIETVRRAAHVDKVVVLPHSFGGVIAINYVAAHPEHVAGLILANSTLHFQGREEEIESIRGMDSVIGAHTEIPVGATDDAVRALAGARFQALNAKGFAYRRLADKLATVETQIKVDTYPRSVDFGTRVMTDPDAMAEYYRDYRPLSAKVTAPVLVITGARDYAVGPHVDAGLRFPHMTIERLSGSHLLYYENAPAFTAAVRRFMASAGSMT